METLSLALLIVCVYSLVDLYKKCSSNQEVSITESIKQNAGNLIIIAILAIVITQTEKGGDMLSFGQADKFSQDSFYGTSPEIPVN